MRKFKKFASVMAMALSCFVLGTSMAGCGGSSGGNNDGGNKNDNDENTVVIDFYKGGYGRQFLDDLAKAFMDKNPGKKIVLKPSVLRGQILDRLSSGPKSNDADIIMTNAGVYNLLGAGASFGQPAILEPLTDVYDYVDPTTGKTIRENSQKSFRDSTTFAVDGKESEYLMIWASGLQGIVYNTDLLKKADLPRTTDELIALSERLKTTLPEGKFPFVYSGKVDYWTPMHQVWWAQYDGEEAFNKFFEGEVKQKDPFTGEEKYTRSPAIFSMPGRLESLKVMENLLKHSNGYCNPNSTAYDYKLAERSFVKGEAVMHPNGDWLSDMIEKAGMNASFMKMPVISALKDKLPTVNDDATLSKVVAFVDGDLKDAPAGVSPEDIERVKSARKMIFLASTTHIVGIPSYANAKNLAKDFLKFMYSYEGSMIFAKATKGANLPMDYDYKGNAEVYGMFSDFQKSRLEIMQGDTIGVFPKFKHQIVYRGGLVPYSHNGGVLEASFGATNPRDFKSAEDIINVDIQKYNTVGWNNLLKLAGLA